MLSFNNPFIIKRDGAGDGRHPLEKCPSFQSVVVGVCHRVLPRGSTDDLLGKTQPAQSKEFALRARIQSNADVLRSATITNADLLQHSDRLGVLKPGAFADLLPVNGDPLKDLGVLSGQGEHLDVIVRGGVIFKNVLQ
jgi:hypothetical protein